MVVILVDIFCNMPYYLSQIETLDNLQYVAGLVDGFNQDRFLAALMGNRNQK